MGEKQDSCLAAPEILAYLEGSLPAERQAEVDRHLLECRLCGGAVEGVDGIEWREGFLRSADSVRARVRARTAAAVTAATAARARARRFRPAPRFLALAATLVLGAGTAVYLGRPGPGQALFNRYFEPYPSNRPVVRGSAPADARSSALALYEAHDYSGALAAFEAGLRQEPGDAEVLFYAGLSRLAMGQAREAVRDLEQVRQRGDSELRAPAAWYLALAHLRGRDLAAARSQLAQVVEGGGFYRDRAQALLSDLDRLDRGR
jgi:tetratricopeptide (TPR) repeat protein